MAYKLSLEPSPHPDDMRALKDGLESYNRQFAPPIQVEPLAILVRDPENNLVGGLLGGTFWGWLYIEIFWLAEHTRHQGVGARVLRMAEQEAVRRGCHHAFLDTTSFQAREFYEKFGYVVFARLDDFPVGFQRYYLKKELG